ncbi:hypothetical protein GOP47_0026713 [Adiantum capillus-veneris]|nr:hypothetical protein GOP47_0026713 [Adiantum capillus-veneris]
MSTSPKTILPSLNHHLSIDGITEEPYLGNESEDMPSHIIPLLPSREEEKTQISIETSGQCSWMQATFNGVNVMVGVGLLSCPYAVKKACTWQDVSHNCVDGSLCLALCVWCGVSHTRGRQLIQAFSKLSVYNGWNGHWLICDLCYLCYNGDPAYCVVGKPQLALCSFVFTLCFFSYFTMSVVGFRMFGDETLSQITLNLSKTNKATYFALFLTILNPNFGAFFWIYDVVHWFSPH